MLDRAHFRHLLGLFPCNLNWIDYYEVNQVIDILTSIQYLRYQMACSLICPIFKICKAVLLIEQPILKHHHRYLSSNKVIEISSEAFLGLTSLKALFVLAIV